MNQGMLVPAVPHQRLATCMGLWPEGFDFSAYNARSGRIALCTDIGSRIHKDKNEDALGVDFVRDAFIVADGMGGYQYGREAAIIVAEEFLRGLEANLAPQQIQITASIRIKNELDLRSGACYAAFRLQGKKVHFYHAGDCQALVCDRNGNIKFATTPDGSLGNAPRGKTFGHVETDTFSIMNYDRIIAGSDGLFDNIRPEIFKELSRLPVDRALEKLISSALEVMKNGFFDNGQGRFEHGKPDNITAVIYEIIPVPLRVKE